MKKIRKSKKKLGKVPSPALGGGGGPGNPAAAPPVAPVQGCAGPPVRVADPDVFPRDSQPMAGRRAEIGVRFNVKMTNRDMR